MTGWADDYVPVSERIEAFIDKYPDGSLQSEIVELTDKRVTIKALAYRKPDDPRPGIGLSFMAIPGGTGFTRGSELENTETSAWGRAIVAVGIGAKRNIASREEVANKQPAQGEQRTALPAFPSATTPAPVSQPGQAAPVGGVPPPAPAPRTAEEEALLDELLALVPDHTRLRRLADVMDIPTGQHANAAQLREMLKLARSTDSRVEPWPAIGSAEFKALSGYERATARAWWQKHAGAAVESPPTPAPAPDKELTNA